MELQIKNGDYVSDGAGGLVRLRGSQALLQRVLYRLTAHRGTFPFLEDMGSRLWLLGRVAPAERLSAAKQYVAEALAPEEGLTVTDVTLTPRDRDGVDVTVYLTYEGEDLSVRVAAL